MKLPSFSVGMRALVLLCLLNAAFAQNEYSWNGPVRIAPDPDPNAGSACSTDKFSCGCCLMVQEVNRLKTYFNKSMTELEKDFQKTKESLRVVEASRVAFSVSLFSDENFKCYGPFSEMNKVVIYKNVFLNLGGAYNMNTGIFTVPFSGVYSLAVTIFSDAGSPGNMLAACANLQVNNKVMARAKEFNTNDQEDSATIVVAMHLKVGDMVTVTLSSGCYLCDESYYNTFSGFLLYVTE
ncbi:uncharacterized protein LOC120744971 [Simochromis diagramma]|uniref:uncharacterized protein LOC120744971 n=1 Tax=Simochromis diagramma TaxID=43689 RepID=UPI001A7EFB0E|nr:uncharacterized protein LOC120744971 [Simochromis diagramma]